ncbi:MAG: hypothetical protein ACREBU_09320 [Nitrososphaera sp.]
MPTELVSLGPPQSIIQNQIYALPVVKCTMFSDTAGTFQQADDVGFAAPIAVTLTGGQAELAGGFFRCTSGNVTVLFKRA